MPLSHAERFARHTALLARRHGLGVLALEKRPSLCAEGQRLADRQGLPVTLQPQDVLAADTSSWIGAGVQVAALHACGDLHLRLIELAARSGCRLTLAPCCYPRTAATHYRPLSHPGRRRQMLYPALRAASQRRDPRQPVGPEPVQVPQKVW
ncbi:methyltransferase [Thioalkalivibrio nitratireducens]|uniref:methyltransferase n=1 Tax=Thioalkalivibrio nitratireducens TaxID=186931 RepID=UPI00030DEA47|nr:methyltransferase [Thioalkalivibrio nitratireducens]